MKYKYKIIILCLIIIFFNLLKPAGKIFNFKYSDEDKYELKIVANYRIYLNNKYKGFHTNVMKGILDIENINEYINIYGNVYHYDKSIRNNVNIGNIIDKYEECNFSFDNHGNIINSSNPVFPPLHNIPFFPEYNLNINDIYKGYGKASISLYNSDKIDVLKIQSICKYSGKSQLFGETYDFFEISYDYIGVESNSNIKSARGRHNLEFYFDSTSGKPVFIKDKFVEEFDLNDGNKVKHDGFLNYFYKKIKPLDKDKVIKEFIDELDDDILDDIDFIKKKEGISLTLNNLKFKPDSVELLNNEYKKLNKIFKVLSEIKDRDFMIIGHTALAGTESERLKLSLDRAKSIAKYFIERGIKSERIFVLGKGAKEPVAPNDTEENMKKNRRVEIIILEN